MSDATGPVDVKAVVDDIKTTVAGKQARGEYPPELLAALGQKFDVAAQADPPEVLSLIQSARPIESGRPIVGPLVKFAKRVERRLLAWYVHPITRDQTRFNDAITREVRALQRRVDALESASKVTDPHET